MAEAAGTDAVAESLKELLFDDHAAEVMTIVTDTLEKNMVWRGKGLFGDDVWCCNLKEKLLPSAKSPDALLRAGLFDDVLAKALEKGDITIEGLVDFSRERAGYFGEIEGPDEVKKLRNKAISLVYKRLDLILLSVVRSHPHLLKCKLADLPFVVYLNIVLNMYDIMLSGRAETPDTSKELSTTIGMMGHNMLYVLHLCVYRFAVLYEEVVLGIIKKNNLMGRKNAGRYKEFVELEPEGWSSLLVYYIESAEVFAAFLWNSLKFYFEIVADDVLRYLGTKHGRRDSREFRSAYASMMLTLPPTGKYTADLRRLIRVLFGLANPPHDITIDSTKLSKIKTCACCGSVAYFPFEYVASGDRLEKAVLYTPECCSSVFYCDDLCEKVHEHEHKKTCSGSQKKASS